jgi:plasmid stability protein
VPTITVRDLPSDLHAWLKQRAAAHRRSVNKEIVVLLDSFRIQPGPPALMSAERLARIQEIAERCAQAPEVDPRTADEIVGYAEDGTPH